MRSAWPAFRSRSLLLVASVAGLALAASWPAAVQAGGLVQRSAVGGVSINADGVISNPVVAEVEQIRAAWQAGLENVPADLDRLTELRFVSLKQLEQRIAELRQQGRELPDEVRYLAGLQRVQYVLVYPERGDIVLAGPAEGWRIDSLGNVVGATTGRPVLLLDDLMVALRVAMTSNQTGISCSIDPTPEGLRRVQQLSPTSGLSPEVYARQMEEALGTQVVTVSGVPATSHFARTLVAADFRMKRLAMHFEPAPVDGMPSYMELARNSSMRSANVLPRWWLAPKYEPLRRDAAGLAWEIRGQGVQCLTENDVVSTSGERERSQRADRFAQQWAETFTEKFTELAREDSAFGNLRNAMDLAVVGALLFKEGLIQHASLELPQLMGQAELETYHAPRAVASQASLMQQRRGGWLVSASGGVQVYPWQVADQVEESAPLAETRALVAAIEPTSWWWNGK